jgi:nicotinate phosphoribosyltransferase
MQRFLTNESLLTDFYQLTMMQAYFNDGMKGTAVFEFFIRTMPENRHFFVAAGLESVIEFIQNLQFNIDDINFLREQKLFSEDFLLSLSHFRFTGDVNAMPEGTVFFPNEPVLQIIAPIEQAQLIESRVINLLHVQILIATKAARCVLQAPNKLLVDFGMRRAHGAEAALYAARASYLVGFSGTATVLAGKKYGIPLYGTMAHSYIQAHHSECTAFKAFARAQPNNVTLLIDTYDTERAAHRVVELAEQLQQEGIEIKAVRLDSGDLGLHAKKVRKILDKGHLSTIKIFCSGDLDEYQLHELIKNNYPIDGFGIGTRLNTSADQPFFDCVYKLQEYDGKPRRKKSEGKATWPGRKQVYRSYHNNGMMALDTITLTDEVVPNARPLLEPVIRAGKLVAPLNSLVDLRAYAAKELSSLPTELKDIDKAKKYSVNIAPSLQNLAMAVDKECS